VSIRNIFHVAPLKNEKLPVNRIFCHFRIFVSIARPIAALEFCITKVNMSNEVAAAFEEAIDLKTDQDEKCICASFYAKAHNM